MFRIRFTNSAEADLLELWLTIAEENLVAADESLDSIQSTVSLLATQPEMGKARPELADGLRSFHTRTSYIIFYIEITDHIQDCAESIYPPFFTHRPARAVTHKAPHC